MFFALLSLQLNDLYSQYTLKDIPINSSSVLLKCLDQGPILPTNPSIIHEVTQVQNSIDLDPYKLLPSELTNSDGTVFVQNCIEITDYISQTITNIPVIIRCIPLINVQAWQQNNNICFVTKRGSLITQENFTIFTDQVMNAIFFNGMYCFNGLFDSFTFKNGDGEIKVPVEKSNISLQVSENIIQIQEQVPFLIKFNSQLMKLTNVKQNLFSITISSAQSFYGNLSFYNEQGIIIKSQTVGIKQKTPDHKISIVNSHNTKENLEYIEGKSYTSPYNTLQISFPATNSDIFAFNAYSSQLTTSQQVISSVGYINQSYIQIQSGKLMTLTQQFMISLRNYNHIMSIQLKKVIIDPQTRQINNSNAIRNTLTTKNNQIINSLSIFYGQLQQEYFQISPTNITKEPLLTLQNAQSLAIKYNLNATFHFNLQNSIAVSDHSSYEIDEKSSKNIQIYGKKVPAKPFKTPICEVKNQSHECVFWGCEELSAVFEPEFDIFSVNQQLNVSIQFDFGVEVKVENVVIQGRKASLKVRNPYYYLKSEGIVKFSKIDQIPGNVSNGSSICGCYVTEEVFQDYQFRCYEILNGSVFYGVNFEKIQFSVYEVYRPVQGDLRGKVMQVMLSSLLLVFLVFNCLVLCQRNSKFLKLDKDQIYLVK